MQCDNAFLEDCTAIARNFLQTAVVVDDRAFLHHAEREVGTLLEPRRGVRTLPGQQQTAPMPVEQRQDLDAKVLIDAFAEAGLVCAVLRPQFMRDQTSSSAAPEKMATVKSRARHATHRADIVVIDWRLSADEPEVGTKALELIHSILTDDAAVDTRAADGCPRLRLIAVYTGEPDLEGIARKAEQFLKDKKHNSVTRNGFVVSTGRVRIPVFAKAGVDRQPGEKERQLGEQDVPERLIREFAETNQGLLANVALASLGALRDNTHRVLGRFSAELDPAYVAHRALLVPPEEAEFHPIPLLAAEFESILTDAQVSGHVSGKGIKGWLAAQRSCGLNLDGKFGDMTADQVEEALLVLIEKGLGDRAQSADFPDWRGFLDTIREERDKTALSRITDALTPAGIDGSARDKELALLMSVRSPYGERKPQLTLGTILRFKEKKKQKYLLCIQPRCDSAHVEGCRTFPFLRLEDVGGSDLFELVVKDRGDLRSLRVNLKPHRVKQFNFRPAQGNDTIRAEKKGSGWVFNSTDGPELHWVGDLRREQAQRILNRFASEFSRVGLTESEWLRRMAKTTREAD